jgi:hypothetical protein
MSKPAVEAHGLRKAFGEVQALAAQVRRVIGQASQFAAVDPNLTGRENLRLIGRLSRVGRRRSVPISQSTPCQRRTGADPRRPGST